MHSCGMHVVLFVVLCALVLCNSLMHMFMHVLLPGAGVGKISMPKKRPRVADVDIEAVVVSTERPLL